MQVDLMHWSTILSRTAELKGAIEPEMISEGGQADQANPFAPDTLLPFSTSRPSSLEKILEVLPPKLQVDRYVSTYFKASYLALLILHQSHFQRQYENIWRDPLHATPLWTFVLFSVLTTAATVRLMDSSMDMEEEEARRDDIFTAAAQCLVLGDYGKPQEHVLEALILFVQT